MTSIARSAAVGLVLSLASAAAAEAPRVATPFVVHAGAGDAGVGLTLQGDSYATLRGAGAVTVTGFALDERTCVELDLERFEVLTPDARIVLAGGSGLIELPRPDVVLLRGAVRGEPGSRVVLALSPYGSQGYIECAQGRYIVSTAHGSTVIFDMDAQPVAAVAEPFICGVEELQARAGEFAGFRTRIEALAASAPQAVAVGGGCDAQAEVAIETDYEFSQLFGGDPNAAGAYAVSLIAAVSEIFVQDVGVSLAVSFLRLWEDDSDPWSAADALEQLFDFASFWAGNMNEVERDLAHFLSGRELLNAGGVAFLPGLCTSGSAYGLSAHLDGFFPHPLEDNHPDNWDLVVVAHELGHNFGAPHTHAMKPPVDECASGSCGNAAEGTIMSYCHTCEGGIANIQLHFHEVTITDHLLPYLDGISCELVGEGPAIVQQPLSTTVCEGDELVLAVTASGIAPTYQWHFESLPIPGASEDTHTIAATTPEDGGVYDVTIVDVCGVLTSDAAVVTVDSAPDCGAQGGDPCAADLDGDGFVGTTDFLQLLAGWGTTGPDDLDGGGVGVTDFLLLLAAWGPCPA